MEFIALIVGLVGVLMAWQAGRKQADLKERIADSNSRIYRLRMAAEEQEEALKNEIASLRYEILKLQGNLAVQPEMTIEQITRMHPLATQVLAGYHIGGCASCAVDNHQPLSEAVAMNGRELEPILVALNNLMAAEQNRDGVPEEMIKMSNVELTF